MCRLRLPSGVPVTGGNDLACLGGNPGSLRKRGAESNSFLPYTSTGRGVRSECANSPVLPGTSADPAPEAWADSSQQSVKTHDTPVVDAAANAV